MYIHVRQVVLDKWLPPNGGTPLNICGAASCYHRKRLCMYVSMYVCIYVCMYVYICIYIYIYTHMYTCIYIYIYIYVYTEVPFV